MAFYELMGKSPQVSASSWVAPCAQVIGDVRLGDNASVWFGCVLRGDTDILSIGAQSNIQDLSMLHTDCGIELKIGNRVTVGHKAMLHGCTIGDDSLIGMGAIVLNNAIIGKNCIVGAGALVTEGKSFPDGSLIVGAPARVVRQLSSEEIAGIIKSAEKYAENAENYKRYLKLL